jgi:excisionase family DNA binding protein
MQQLLTVKEYAALKAISENTVRRLIQANKLEIERFGRAIRINPEPLGADLRQVSASSYLMNRKTRGKNENL